MKNTMRKILSTILVVVMLLTAVPLGGFAGLDWSWLDLSIKASAQETYQDGDFWYTVSQGTATLTDYWSGSTAKLNIPATLGGYPVVAIGDNAFNSSYEIISVTIPNTVKSIGKNAFEYCHNLISVNIPDSVKSIGAYAFKNCYALTSITLPAGITAIEDYTFSNCNFTSITIPGSVTSIGDKAFSYCYELTEITIPGSVTSIGDEAFYHCDKLKQITVAPDNTAYSSDENGVLFNKDKTVLIVYPSDNPAEEYSIPDSVKTVSDNAFYSCDALVSIDIPEGVKTIGNYAFEHCFKLIGITIPDSVTSIGNEAFISCSGLKTVSIGKGVSSMGTPVFYYCRNIESFTVDAENAFFSAVDNVLFNKDKTELLEYIDIKPNSEETYTVPAGVEKIGSKAFLNTSNLKSVTIPGSVKVIGDNAFESCYNLTSVTFGNGVTTIGNYAFRYCNMLTDITIPGSVTSIGDEAFYCYSESACDSVIVPDSVTSLGNRAFSYNTIMYCNKDSYAHSYAVTNNYPYILINGTAEDNTVYGSEGSISWTLYKNTGVLEFTGNGDMPDLDSWNYPLWRGLDDYVTYVKISDGITRIGDNAFGYFNNLKIVSIPASVTDMGIDVFYGCNALEGFTIDKNNTAFSTDKYGALYNYEKTELIIGPRSKAVISYVIPDGVTTICESAFYDNDYIESIKIPSSVTKIGYDAFQGCENIKKVYITDLSKWCKIDFESEASTPLYWDVLDQKRGLYLNNVLVTDMVIPEGTTKISKYAFLGYNYLLSVKIPASVTEIGENAFLLCNYLSDFVVDESNAYFSVDENGVLFDKEKTRLICYPTGIGVKTVEEFEVIIESDRVFDFFTEYTVPDTVKTIDPFAFGYNFFLYKVTLPEGLTTIGKEAMVACYVFSLRLPGSMTVIKNNFLPGEIRSVEIGKGTTTIGSGAFEDNGELECIIIPDTVTEIENYAFNEYNNDVITDIYYTGTEEQWNEIEIASSNYAYLSRANIHFNYSCDNHVYEEEIIEGVCAGGYKKLTCDCGWRYYTIFKNENPEHKMSDWVIIEPATCEKEGRRGRYCTICEIHYEIENYKGGHSYKTVVTAPTCTEKGYTTYTCSCGDSYKDNYVEAKNHSYTSSVTTPATHLSTGIRTYTCGVCNASYTEDIAKTNDHSYTAVYTIDPTCEAEGYTFYSCECGHTYNGDKKPATGHNYQDDKCTECGKDKVTNCSCNCHKTGFMSFIWKILRFFYKLFGTNKNCACGAVHY